MQADGRTTPFAVGNQPARDFVEPSEAIFMGIGQGPIAWTPLHAADAYATIARGGVRILPHLRTDQPAKTIDLALNKRSVALALRGLERSVNERDGTGHHIVIEHDDGTKSEEQVFNIPGVQVWGKSGTADAGKKIVGRDNNGKPVFQQDEHGNDITRDHAWFVVLAGNQGENRPRYAVALVVEYGGSGGRVSGPLCNQVLRALVEEGYLRGDNTTPTKSEGDIKGTSPQ
jgi:cell division protein FtsI/penicillin-binding protein 2